MYSDSDCATKKPGLPYVDALLNYATVLGETNDVKKVLRENGADVNSSFLVDSLTPKGHGFSCVWTGVICAAASGNEELLKVLLDEKADVNVAVRAGDSHETLKDTTTIPEDAEVSKMRVGICFKIGPQNRALFGKCAKSDTALTLAAKRGHVNCVKLLLESGADITACSQEIGPDLRWHYNGNALMHATVNNHVDVLNALIQFGADVNFCTSDGGALLLASFAGYAETIDVLIKAGADVNQATEGGRTPLRDAADNCHLNCMDLLMEAGADINYVTPKGMSVLASVSEYGLEEPLEKLLAAGADVNLSSDRLPPLVLAAKEGYRRCVKMLLKAGASVSISTKEGPILVAAGSHRGWRHGSCVDLLLGAGAAIDAPNKNGVVPLMVSPTSVMLRELLPRGADVNAVDRDGNSVLMWVGSAVMRNNYWGVERSTVAVLKKREISVRSSDHNLALKELLFAGAPVGCKNKRGQTALSIQIGEAPYWKGSDEEMKTRRMEEITSILIAAGDTIEGTSVETWLEDGACHTVPVPPSVLAFLKQNDDPSLMGRSRRAIRRHMLQTSSTNLFYRVPQLPVPNLMKLFLLFNVNIDDFIQIEAHESVNPETDSGTPCK